VSGPWPIRRIESLRSPIAILLAALLGLLIYVGNFAWWFEREVVHTESFVGSTAVALGADDARDAMGQLIVDRLVDGYPLLMVVESNLVGMFSDLLATPTLGKVVTSVGVDVHRTIVNGNQDAIVINLEQYRDSILAPIEAISPQLAELVPRDWFVSIEVLETGVLPDLSLYADWAGTARFVAIVGAVLLTAYLLWFVKRRDMGIELVGMALMFAGLASGVLVPGGRWLAIRDLHGESIEVLVTATYNEFTKSLLLSAVVLSLIGFAFVATGIALRSAVEDDDSALPVDD
jgi:hypothetical protein